MRGGSRERVSIKAGRTRVDLSTRVRSRSLPSRGPGVDEALSEVGKRTKLFAGVDVRGDHLMDSRGTDPRKFLLLSLAPSLFLWSFRSLHSFLSCFLFYYYLISLHSYSTERDCFTVLRDVSDGNCFNA